MTYTAMPEFSKATVAHYTRLKSRAVKREQDQKLIQEVRRGNLHQLFPEELGLDLQLDGVPTANFIDTVAKDLAESIAPLPALKCASGRMNTLADQKRAETKNRIGDEYWSHSKLDTQMVRGANRYVSYGFVPFFVEPDTKHKMPYINIESPIGAYYEVDRYGNCIVYAKMWRKSIDDLCSMFPEYAAWIRNDPKTDRDEPNGDTELEVVRWVDCESVSLMLPARDGLILTCYEHKMCRTPVHIAEMLSDEEPGVTRGQFDDVVWVQVARALMMTYALEAASKAVQAPLAVPDDVDEVPFGPDAIIQSQNANQIRRVGIELPGSIFAESQSLDQELKVGSRYPDARTVSPQASVITGKGMEALMGSFDTQIKAAQTVFADALEEVTSMCFEMDEAWWPNESKTLSGTISGNSYEFDYVPSRDIAGRYKATVTYGFAAGMHPSQSIVTMLQLDGAGLIAKETTQANLPFSIDAVQEQKRIHIEGFRDALKQGVFSIIQSAGPIALQGQDPLPYLKLAVDAVKGIQDGDTVENATYKAFTAMMEAQKAEQEAQMAEMEAAAQDAGGAPGGGGDTNPLGANGMPPGVAPGQAGKPAGGLPDIANLVAGFRGNGSLPINQATIQRRVPLG